MLSKTDTILSIFAVFASISPVSSNARRRKFVDLKQTPHVIYQIHQANPGCCTGQANHAKIQAALLIGHGTKDMFNPNSYFGFTSIGLLLSFRERFVSLAFFMNVAAQAQNSQLFFIRLATVGAIGLEIT